MIIFEKIYTLRMWVDCAWTVQLNDARKNSVSWAPKVASIVLSIILDWALNIYYTGAWVTVTPGKENEIVDLLLFISTCFFQKLWG